MSRRIIKKEELEYIKNRKGKNSIRWKSYTYTLNNEKDGRQYWRCSKRPCPARITVNQLESTEQYVSGKKTHNCCACEEGDKNRGLSFSEEATEENDEMTSVAVYNQQSANLSKMYKDPSSVVVSNGQEFRMSQQSLSMQPTQTSSSSDKNNRTSYTFSEHILPISSAPDTMVLKESSYPALSVASSKSNESVCVELPMELENCPAAANTASAPIAAGASKPNPSIHTSDLSYYPNSGNDWSTSSVSSSQDCTTQQYYDSMVTGVTSSPAIASNSTGEVDNELREICEQFQCSPDDTVQEDRTMYQPFFELNEHALDSWDVPNSTIRPLASTHYQQQGLQGTSRDEIAYQSSPLPNNGTFDRVNTPFLAPVEESGHSNDQIGTLVSSSSLMMSQYGHSTGGTQLSYASHFHSTTQRHQQFPQLQLPLPTHVQQNSQLCRGLSLNMSQASLTSLMSNPPLPRTQDEIVIGQFHYPPQQQMPTTYPHLQQGHQPQAPRIVHVQHPAMSFAQHPAPPILATDMADEELKWVCHSNYTPPFSTGYEAIPFR